MVGRSGLRRVLVAAAVLACVPLPISTREADSLFKEGRYEEARQKYEEARAKAPGQPEIHFKLSDTYFELARKALDERKDEKAYSELLSKAQDEAIAGLELNPDNPSGHRRLGLIAAYRSDMDAARESFEVARQLDPVNPLPYIDLAEVSVYRGKLSQARRYIERGRRLGANPAFLEVDELLAAWRAGDFVEAQDLFDNLFRLNPAVVKTWNGAKDIETFEQFTAQCCQQLTCGPFMKSACEQANQRVAERKMLQETLAQEIALEQERRRRLSKVYKRLRELNIEVDEKENEAVLDDEKLPPKSGSGSRSQRPQPGQRRPPGPQ
jgi:tetratricopeptide (TPR) repeat protein